MRCISNTCVVYLSNAKWSLKLVGILNMFVLKFEDYSYHIKYKEIILFATPWRSIQLNIVSKSVLININNYLIRSAMSGFFKMRPPIISWSTVWRISIARVDSCASKLVHV